MIRVTVELISAITGKTSVLGVAEIANDATGTTDVGNYNVVLLKSPAYAKTRNVGKAWRKGRVEGFPRQRLGPWDLLYRALRETVGSRNR